MPTTTASLSRAAQIAFIDTSIAHYQALAADIAAGIEIVLIDRAADGMTQIAAALAGRSGVDAVHVFSHGGEGLLELGNAYVCAANLAAYAGELALVRAALAPDADILLYGCHAGAGARGQNLIEALAQATGADVAASATLTGAAALGGDWLLERRVGHVKAAAPFAHAQPAYAGTLMIEFQDGDFDSYNVDSTTATVRDTTNASVQVTFAQTVPDAVEGKGLGYDGSGLYAYNVNTGSGVSLTITAPTGHTFDLADLLVAKDPGQAMTLQMVATLADGTEVPITATLVDADGQAVVSAFSQPIDDVVKLVINADTYASFNDFDIRDVKPIAATPDTTPPAISAVAVPDATMKIGDTVTATITVAADADTYTLGAGSSIAGHALGDLVKVNDTTYTATFTITEGSGDVAAGADLAVNLVLVDGAANASSAYTQAIAQAGDAIDATRPGAATVTLLAADDSGNSSSDGLTKVVQPRLAGTAEANGTVTLSIDGSVVASGIAVDGAGKWTYTPATALAEGAHAIKAFATDAAGNAGTYGDPLSVKIDTTPPVVSIASDAANLKAGTTATITFTFSEDPGTSFNWDGSSGSIAVSGGTLSALSGSGTTRTAIFTPTPDTDASTASIAVGAGNYQDAAGNAGAAGSLLLPVDTRVAAPTITGASAASDSGGSSTDGISNVATPAITGHAEAHATVRLYDNGGATLLGTVGADASGNWSITSSTLREGPHTLTAVQTDPAGNVSAASAGYTYVLDTAAPTAIGLSASTVALAAATNGATLATLSATDTDAVSYALVAGNGTNDANNGQFVIAGGTLAAAQDLGVGVYHLYVQATDAAGNASVKALELTVVDAPTVTSIVRTGGASGTVAAGATSVSYTVTFSQSVSGVDGSDFSVTASDSASGHVANVSGSGTTYTVTVDGLAGTGTLRLDLNGSGTGIQNGSSVAIAGAFSAGQTFTLDHTAPAAPGAPAMSAASDSGRSSSDAVTQDTTPTFTGSADAFASVTLYDTDGTTVLGTQTADDAGRWNITSSVLGAGSHTLTVKQTDAAGNVSGAGSPLQVVIDTSAAAPAAPTLDSDSGAAGDRITNVATPTISGSAEALAAITLYDGGSVVGTTTADATGHWSVATTTLLDGPHTLTAVQVDLAGNVSGAGAGLALVIDSAAPAQPPLPVLAPASDSGTAGDGITTVARPVVTGTAEAGATVRLYDGATLVGTAVADHDGNWSITSAALAVGTHALTAVQTDVAGNPSPASAALALTIQAPPAPPPSGGTSSTIDGVTVTQQDVTLPGGGSGTEIVVPVVTGDRVESTGSGGVADIPLASGGAGTLLLAQLAPGFGLSASGGASVAAGDATERLIQAILAATPDHTANDQGHLTGNGVTFLAQLAASTPLLVETVVPTSGTSAPAGTLTLTGTSTDSQRTALVIDTGHLAAGSKLVLDAVDFAAIVGSADVTGNTQGQILTGDAAAQKITVTAADGSAVFSGGGDDTLVLAPAASRVVAHALAAGAASADADATTILHGGQGSDTVVFDGASADYTVERHDGYLVVTANAQPTEHALVINAENLQFSDATVAVENRPDLTVIAGLYQDILGRQADYLGMDYWGQAQQAGASLGRIALAMIASTEAQDLHGSAFTGDSAHDVALLYQRIFDRAGDSAGLAFWVGRMAEGMTLEQVAQGFVQSDEMTHHVVGVADWDFQV